METEVEFITPSMAAKFLEKNFGNRPIQKSSVEYYANILRRGEFMEVHHPIAFAPDGNLMDGQHRLSAIVATGISAPLNVSRNCNPKSFRVMDQGRKRSHCDLSGIGRRVTEGCSFAARLLHGSRFTYPQLEPILNSRIGMMMVDLIDSCGTQRRFFTSAPMKLACVLTSLKGEKDRVFAFSAYRALANFDFDGMTSSARALVRQEKTGGTQVSGGPNDTFARGLIVFNQLQANVTRIVVSPSSASEAAALARDTIRAYLT